MFKSTKVLLNCDLGECLPASHNSSSQITPAQVIPTQAIPTQATSKQTIDEQVMPLIDMANIACGGHAGNVESMHEAVSLAKQFKVQVGAHPSYPDLAHFGRRPIEALTEYTFDDIKNTLRQQIETLDTVCKSHELTLSYIKPHGALYHDALKHTHIFDALLVLAQDFHLPLLLLSHSRSAVLQKQADQYNVKLLWEAFADRAYDDQGQLLNRAHDKAVHSSVESIVKQAHGIVSKRCVVTINNNLLEIPCHTLCVHGDTPLAFEALQEIRRKIN